MCNSIVYENISEIISVNFLIVTANMFEYESVSRLIKPIDGHLYEYKSDSGNTYHIGVFGKYLVAHLHLSQQGANRAQASANSIADAIADFSNRGRCSLNAIFVVGIAFGTDEEKTKIGDVIISEKIIPYECVKVIESNGKNGEIEYENRNSAYTISPKLITSLQTIKWRNNSNNHVVFGDVASGEELINNKTRVQQIKQILKDYNLIGGEMEGAGVARSASRAGNIDYIIIKSICDWGYNKDDDKDRKQKFAADNAATVLYQYFSLNKLGEIYNKPKAIIQNADIIDTVEINGCRLFWYRNKQRMTLEKLAKALKAKGIKTSVKTLERLEKVEIIDNKYKFQKTQYCILEKLENILSCVDQLTDLSMTDEECHFYLNYPQKSLCPVKDVKAVVFDFDGTLTAKKNQLSSWQLLWKELGYDDSECRNLFLKHARHEINHAQWCYETQIKYIERNLSFEQVKHLADGIELICGATELLKMLNDNGVKVYICSGSINTIIDTVIERENIGEYINDRKCNVFEYDRNGKLSRIIGTQYDFEGKKDYINMVINTNNFLPDEVAFVGNSDNDVWAYKSYARTILINANNVNPGNAKIWNYYLGNITDLKKLLPYLLPTKYCIN